MEGLPQSYVIQQLYSYCKRPVYKKFQGNYNAECCICNEGDSAGKKRRLFYFPQERYFYCFNCSKSWKEINWLQEVTKKTIYALLQEASNYEGSIVTNTVSSEKPLQKEIPSIPEDSIDLLDSRQCQYYANTSSSKVLQDALDVCKERRLFTAVNKPKTFYISLQDKVHKNRLIIPFYSTDNKIECYQSRSLYKDQQPKYLTKFGEKTLYGENNIKADIPYIFLFEGPIDSMFVQNGVAMAGTSLTERQEAFLKKHFDKEVIYVYDNDKDNKQMDKRIKRTINEKKRVFIWPKEFSKFKDINEMCTKLQLDEVPWKLFVQNSYKGLEAITRKALK